MAVHLPVTPILVDDFATLLKTLGGGNTAMADHLEAVASLKRLENAVKKATTELLPYANAAFSKAEGTVTLESGAQVKKYTKPKKWIFPEHIQQRENELKVMKDQAKDDGSAQQEEVDPAAQDRNFSVSAPLLITSDDMVELVDAAETLSKSAPIAPPPTA